MPQIPGGFALNPLKTEDDQSLAGLPGPTGTSTGPPAPATPPTAEIPVPTPIAVPATPPPGFELQEPPPGFVTKEEQIANLDPETAEFGDVISKAITNLPESTLQLGKDMISPITQPVETAKGLFNMMAGVFQKAIPGEQSKEKYADLLVDFYKDRYGSIAGFKKALAKDPAGVLSDGATVLIPGGTAVRGLGTAAKVKNLTKLSQIAAKTGKGMSRLGVALDPLGAAAEVTGQVLGKSGLLLDKFRGVNKPVEAYRNATKFSTTLPIKKQRELAQFALDEKIMPTLTGMDKTTSQINVLATQINDLIDRGVQTGKAVPVKRFFREFRQLQENAHLIDFSDPMKARKVVSQIRKQMHDFNAKIKGGKPLSVPEVQAAKQGIYQKLSKYYNEARTEPMKVKTQLALARAAKQSLEDFFPEIAGLNKKEGMYLELRDALEGPAARIDKQKFWNVMTSMRAMAGGAVAGPVGVSAGLIASVYNQPQIKAKLAIIGNSLRKQGIQLSPMWTELRILGALPSRTGVTEEE